METAEEKEALISGKNSIVKDIATTLKFRHFVLGAIAIFFYIVIEVGIPAMGLNYMTEQIKNADGTLSNGPGYVGAVVAGSVAAAYWFLMMVGRIFGGVLGGKISSRAMITGVSSIAIALLLGVIFMPVVMIEVPGLNAKIPLAMCLMAACGLCTSVMWGGLFNMATEGLGKYVPIASGIYMAMVSGGKIGRAHV